MSSSAFIYGQYMIESWRNFVLLQKIPSIEASNLNWLAALWVQIFLVAVVLIIGIYKLYRQSKRIHEDALSSIENEVVGNQVNGSKNWLYITELHSSVSTYYKSLGMGFQEV